MLPDGRIFRVTGQPHPRGAIAFLFEDISVQVATERQRRQDVSLNQSILNGLPDAVAVISPSGIVNFANTALGDLFGTEFCETLVCHGIPDLPESKLIISDPTDFWPKLKTYVATPMRRAPWEQQLTAEDNTKILAKVSTMPDGSTLAVFKANTKFAGEVLPALDCAPDPLHFATLENMLRQREISLDHSGFDIDSVDQLDAPKMRRILWYLVIAVANSCRKGGKLVLLLRVEGQYNALSCNVSEADHVEVVQENVAENLLKSLTAQPDGRNSWTYDAENGRHTVSFKARNRLKLSAL